MGMGGRCLETFLCDDYNLRNRCGGTFRCLPLNLKFGLESMQFPFLKNKVLMQSPATFYSELSIIQIRSDQSSKGEVVGLAVGFLLVCPSYLIFLSPGHSCPHQDLSPGRNCDQAFIP